jgi:hypothetical protein
MITETTGEIKSCLTCKFCRWTRFGKPWKCWKENPTRDIIITINSGVPNWCTRFAKSSVDHELHGGEE